MACPLLPPATLFNLVAPVWTSNSTLHSSGHVSPSDDLVPSPRKRKEKDTGPALPCIEKNDSRGEPQAIATLIDAGEEMSDSEDTGAW